MKRIPKLILSSKEDVMYRVLENECSKLMSALGRLPVPHYIVAPQRRTRRPKRGHIVQTIASSKSFKN